MKTIYLDFDNTMVESNKRVIEILNKRYDLDKQESDLKDYGYCSIHNISSAEKLSIFESDEFFQELQWKPRMLDIIAKHYNNFNWVITTKGTQINLEKKFAWLEKNLCFKMETIGLNNGDLNWSKATIDMTDGIQIDDLAEALDTKAVVKVLYKDYNDHPWQQINPGDEILVVNDWCEIDDILGFYAQYDAKTLERKG